jgi:6-phosphogluconate dehydrogenase
MMGGNLTLNCASRSLRVAGYTHNYDDGLKLAKANPQAKLAIAKDVKEFVVSLEWPQHIVLLVNAGILFDTVLDPLLEKDDMVVDAENPFYSMQLIAETAWSHFSKKQS